MNANLAVYGCYLNGFGTCSGLTNIAPVGSIPLGNGLFGQADLAGNIAEWTADGRANYAASCDNCAYLDVPDTFPAIRGGMYGSSVGGLAASSRENYFPEGNFVQFGFRCARIP
jgi:formylglycine-generating enzyme